VPSPELIKSFRRARATYKWSVSELVPLVTEMAVESVAQVLPGASELAVHGEMTEDWLRILRIQRVLDSRGHVLHDVEVGHDDEAAEKVIDEVNVEYLDLLLDLTGDEFMGSQTIGALSTGRAPS
jgi:hypothetical protein